MIKPLFSASFLYLVAASPVSAVSLINLNFSGSMTSVQQQTFVDAAAFWNSTITGYTLNSFYGTSYEHSLTIDVSLPAIDGVSGTLGSAGPTDLELFNNYASGSVTQSLWYSSQGTMQFDSADVAAMVAANTFYGVVLHEMAHVLGIGTLWAYNTQNAVGNNLYTAGSGQYYGPAALAAWQTEFGQTGATFVPVELGGGEGTAGGHWNEVDGGAGNTGFTSNLTGLDLSTELMTGWASSTFFLSTLTLGGLADLGYTVDYSKAGPISYNQVVSVPEPTGVLALAALLAGGLMTRRVSRTAARA